MNFDSPLADCEIRGGTRLTLYANRLVRQGADAMESVPLAHLASVRGRDRRLVEFAELVCDRLAARKD